MLVLLQALYVGAGLVLVAHAILQVDLLRAARRASTRPAGQPAPKSPGWTAVQPAGLPATQRPRPGSPLPTPFVVVQLPVFNEPAVVVRLLDAVVAMDYPPGRWRVQVLDDSTDETPRLVQEWLRKTEGSRTVAVEHLRRPDRAGFKAGALAAALESAPEADFVAVLDADFVPGEDFLRAALAEVPAQVAVIQGRWAHLNADESWLTRAQAAMLDNHFRVEQAGRLALGAFGAFNGSGGLIRVAALTEVGGWSSASLTEDFDLSLRLQLAGWRVRYAGSLALPAELPSSPRALRIQQHRWMRGVAQNTRGFLPAVLRSGQPWRQRAHALGQVAETATFVALATEVVLAPVMAATAGPGWSTLVAANVPMALTFVLLVPVYGYSSQQPGRGRTVAGRLRRFGEFVLLSGGLTLHNAIAVVAGWAHSPTGFERTPKAGSGPPAPTTPTGRGPARPRPRTLVEAGLGLGVVAACVGVVLHEPSHAAYLWPVLAWAAGAGALALTRPGRGGEPTRLIHLHQAHPRGVEPH
jgi:glycosyltransferase involved in cell wall biosynthesis